MSFFSPAFFITFLDVSLHEIFTEKITKNLTKKHPPAYVFVLTPSAVANELGEGVLTPRAFANELGGGGGGGARTPVANPPAGGGPKKWAPPPPPPPGKKGLPP
jgi:hypothetical protein